MIATLFLSVKKNNNLIKKTLAIVKRGFLNYGCGVINRIHKSLSPAHLESKSKELKMATDETLIIPNQPNNE